MARLAARPRRRGRRHRDDHAANPVPRGDEGRRRTRRWSGGCADRCCCSARCSHDADARTSRRPAATSRRAARSPRTSARCGPWARATLDAPGHVLEAPDGLKAVSMYLDEASVTGTETALLAAALRQGVTEIRHAATEPHVVELCEFLAAMGAGVDGRGHVHDSRRGRVEALRGADAHAVGRLHRGRQLGGRRRRSPAARSRSDGARAEDIEVRRRGAQADERRVHAATRTRSRSSRRSRRPCGASRPASGRRFRATW